MSEEIQSAEPVTFDIEAMLPDIARKAAEKLEARVDQHISYHLGSVIEAEVKAIIEADVLPEVRRQLGEQRPALVAGIVAAVAQANVKLAEIMVARATDRLASHTGDQIVDEIFKKLGRGY